jgi:hypothetical protein
MAERRASTKRRSSTRAGAAAPKKAATQGDQLRDVLVEAARTELAAVSAGVKFWGAWAQSVDTYTRALDDELARLEQVGDSANLVGRISDLTRAYLRDVSQLPSTAVKEFNSRLETIGKAKPKRTRAARVKT